MADRKKLGSNRAQFSFVRSSAKNRRMVIEIYSSTVSRGVDVALSRGGQEFFSVGIIYEVASVLRIVSNV